MARKGWNQKRLSEKAMISQAGISKILNHKIPISANNALKIAQALDIEIDDLFEIRFKEAAE